MTQQGDLPHTQQPAPQGAGCFRMRRRKLPHKYMAVAFPFTLSIMMTCLVAGVSTLVHMGFVDGFVRSWMKSWAVSWITAFPILLLVLPLVRRLVGHFVEASPPSADTPK
jgi:hypothetical protein